MRELVLTRHNHLVDPGLHVWAWQIPVYLFLGGLVAGMMVLSGWVVLKGAQRERPFCATTTPWLGLVLLSLGMLALFLDLEHKRYVWRLYTTFQATSPMSWGAWILILVYPALLAAALIHPAPWMSGRIPQAFAASRRIAGTPWVRTAIGVANVGLGVALGIYTGILLSSLGARPLWNSALLGPLFLTSGLSSAAAFVHLSSRHEGERETLARADVLFLGVELALIVLFLIGLAGGGRAHHDAALLVLGGPMTAVFWVIVVGLGIVVPLVVQPLAVSHRVAHTPVAPLLVLAGGLALRFVVVFAGQESRWAQVVVEALRALA